MKILLLSPHIHLIEHLMSYGDEVTQTIEPLTGEIIQDKDFIISYGYRHKIEKPVLDKFQGRAINLHISYLPWNRGADPTFWEFAENTPKGVTIHFIEEGIDTGDIIAQRYLKYDIGDTFKTFYEKKQECIEDLFVKIWPYIREGKAKRYKQSTYHNSKDKERYKSLLVNGWDTPVTKIIGKGIKK